jgi:plastocyanin
MVRSAAFGLLAMLTFGPVAAGVVTVDVRDTHGKPVSGAVVELTADVPAASVENHIAARAIIDQRHERFLPLVSLIRTGGDVVFTNNDTTMHQVYSFSAIKQFQFEIDQGQRSQAVLFDKPGVASIGCNIHDQMITYVYVAASPYAVIADAAGHATLNVPAGSYHAAVWHPQIAPGTPPLPQSVVVTAASVWAAFALSLLPPPKMSAMHMGQY